MSPWVKSRYPEAWPMIREGIRVRSGGRLTVAHLDHDPEHNAPENLRHLCQRCHLRYDLEHHRHNARRTRDARRGQLALPLPEVRP